MTAHFKQPKPAKNPYYLEKVRGLPCCICTAFGMVQTSPTEAHHVICGRFSQQKTPDIMSVPLCQCHHQGLRHDRDRSKIAIHQNKRAWVEAYGPDHDYIAATQDAILGGRVDD